MRANEKQLRHERDVYKSTVEQLSMQIRQLTIELSHYRNLTIERVEIRSERERNLELFFTQIENYLQLNVTANLGHYALDHKSIGKLMEMFKPTIN